MRNKKLIALLVILGGLTLLVVLNSVIFSVQHVVAYCINDEDAEMSRLLETYGTNGMRRGQSILLLNADDVIAHIEAQSEFASIKVHTVERKFPNRVYINYKRILPYFTYTTADGSVLQLSTDLKILHVYDSNAVPETVNDLIMLKTDAAPDSLTAGGFFYEQGGALYETLRRVTTSFDQIAAYGDCLALFESVDVAMTGVYGKTYFKMRSGTYLKILSSDDRFFDVLHSAFSLYAGHDEYRSRGMIVAGPGTAYWSYLEYQDYDPIRADYRAP